MFSDIGTDFMKRYCIKIFIIHTYVPHNNIYRRRERKTKRHGSAMNRSLERTPELVRSRIDEGGSASENKGGGGFFGISTETSVDALSTLEASASAFVKFASAFESLPETTETIASKVSGFCITLTVAATVFKKVLELLESTTFSADSDTIEPEFAVALEITSIDEEETDADELSAPSVLACETVFSASSEMIATFVRSNNGENVSNERRRDDWLFAETTIVASVLNAAL